MKQFVAIALLSFAAAVGAMPGTPTNAAATLTGEVLETKDASSYTYLRIKTKEGEVWAAVSRVPVKVGSVVTIEDAALMTNFTSPTLGKTFDKIIFGRLAGAPGAAAAAAPSQASAAPLHGAPPAIDVGNIKVPRATGPDARTIAEITVKPAALKDRTVAVRGKVVKYTPDVLGKNWIHLRDGSGEAAKGTNDILVTSKDSAKVGDVVLVRGVVRTDVDLGSGYAYKVIVDQATLSR